ncbi:hypothetical protein O7623_12910 [Solwaraspora sp. WMMD791]|uniref:aa3-type cytochrome oxidase subunit CtaJ n=1 Tax=Solwaraspora sp. WMMD791 TaxID=3016086 RepID=UPI00249B4309|nr:hypothetical protein [Solwaraspora sp. WMMD791]WFE30026.1 hypothetical protein O7623_12910 [Solwaraspora sp. WMMD791]
MSVTHTVLYFVVIPAAVVLVVAALALVGGRGGADRRYRPGRPFEFSPVWFVAAGDRSAGVQAAELPAGTEPAAIESAEAGSGQSRPGATGGASDRW